MNLRIRPAEPQDLPVIDGLGTRSYPGNYFEGHASFASKITGNPETCWVATANDYVVGYAISFPWILGEPYPIDKIYAPAEKPDCLYIHDVCVAPRFRKMDLGHKLVAQVLAGSWDQAALVAVMGSQPFWEKQGFVQEHALDYYGLPASYMTWKR